MNGNASVVTVNFVLEFFFFPFVLFGIYAYKRGYGGNMFILIVIKTKLNLIYLDFVLICVNNLFTYLVVV